jgi:hypothetical protein
VLTRRRRSIARPSGRGGCSSGPIDRVEERLLEAENAFRAAAAEGSSGAREALAFLLVQRGESAEAVEILRDLTARDAKNVWTRPPASRRR